jgi:hypothetical protein
LNESIGPVLFGRIGWEMSTFDGANLTGIYVTPSNLIGLAVVFVAGTKC